MYFEDEQFVVFENLNTVSPILIAKKHVSSNFTPIQAFAKIKEICSKLYGDLYSLLPSQVDEVHYTIRSVKLS